MIYEQMKEKDPERDPLFTAIEVLKNPDDIRQFFKEYEEYMIKHSDASIKGREREVARSDVGYVLGYYCDETRKLWYGVLSEVGHPFFGHGFGREGK
jgi:hypothetical protein